MKSTKRDKMASAIIHAQMLLICLDDVAEEQDLFKHDYKKKVKNLIFETESKLNMINNALDEDEKTAYYELLDKIIQLYNFMDNLNCITKLNLFAKFVEQNKNNDNNL
jgi:hypothetical protein